jgi:hypothetical protein
MELTVILGDSKAACACDSPVGRGHERRYRGRSEKVMKRSIVAVALLIFGIFLPPAEAADGVKPWRYTARSQELPFARGDQAQSAWASGACWSECGSYCTWGQAGCLEHDAQGQCVKLADKCDRYCQRECRTSGGPLLPVEFPWD